METIPTTELINKRGSLSKTRAILEQAISEGKLVNMERVVETLGKFATRAIQCKPEESIKAAQVLLGKVWPDMKTIELEDSRAPQVIRIGFISPREKVIDITPVSADDPKR